MQISVSTQAKWIAWINLKRSIQLSKIISDFPRNFSIFQHSSQSVKTNQLLRHRRTFRITKITKPSPQNTIISQIRPDTLTEPHKAPSSSIVESNKQFYDRFASLFGT